MGKDANLYTLLEGSFQAAGTAPAICLPGGKRALDYTALADGAARYANALASLGVEPGDRVTVQIEKSIPNILLYLATLKAGAVFQPLNTAYTPAELEYFIADARPRLVVVDPARQAEVASAAQNVGASVATLDKAGNGSLAEHAELQSVEHTTVPRAKDDLAGLVYTSGTTGRSKGAMLSHENLVSNAETLHRIWGFVPGDVLLHALPVFHVHGLFVALNTIFLNGSRVLWHNRFTADAVLADLKRATVMMGVPTFYTRLLAEPGLDADACSNMRLFISGSAPLLAETHREFENRTGQRILERYGMTETGMITSNPYEGERIAGTVGFALPDVSIRISDEGGQALPSGEIGTLEVKGPNVFKGYWDMPDKTAAEFREDGYFITGDLAQMDHDGRVSIVGRGKDLIISGGLNVYPKEIETEIDQLPGIAESAVAGVPHPDFGEAVVAFVTAADDGVPDESKLIAALSGRLAKFKLPKRVILLDELPRNAMGKVQKAQLRETYADLFAA